MSHFVCGCGGTLRHLKSVRVNVLTQEHQYQCRKCRLAYHSKEVIELTPLRKTPSLFLPKNPRTNRGISPHIDDDYRPRDGARPKVPD